MKKLLLTLISLTMLTSCLKDDFAKDYTEENELQIEQYIADNNLNATKDEYGIYYIIEEQGTGLQPAYGGVNDVVTVNYTGSYLNGEVFDENNTGEAIFSLYNVIDGWKIGIPYFKEGGSGKLIIPSRYGYGSSEQNGIPGGSVLVFDIELLSVDFKKENDEEIIEYFNDDQNNVQLENAVKTDSGLYYIIEEEGTGEYPTSTDDVTVAYKGYYTDNSTFDESDEDGISFNLQDVIPGWTEGITYFREGSKGKLFIPSRLGYGNYLYNYSIPGGSVLIFDIEMISID